MTEPVTPETAVPPGETPAARCPYCERPFRTERLCTLHVVSHASCTDAERDAFEAAREVEDDDLFLFHLKVIGALGAVYAFFIVTYIVAFSIGG